MEDIDALMDVDAEQRAASDAISPRSGYDTEEKQKYRDSVWQAFSGTGDLSARTGKFLIMPSREGLEIETAMRFGIKAEQIFCVDRSAAVIATSLWRKRWPEIEFASCEISDIAKILRRRGVVLFGANLDLCGRVSAKTIEAVRAFWADAPKYNDFLFSVTVARGREDPALAELVKHLGFMSEYVDGRIAALLIASGITCNDGTIVGNRSIEYLGGYNYTSGRHPMAWAAMRYRDHQYDIDAIREISIIYRDISVGIFSRIEMAVLATKGLCWEKRLFRPASFDDLASFGDQVLMVDGSDISSIVCKMKAAGFSVGPGPQINAPHGYGNIWFDLKRRIGAGRLRDGSWPAVETLIDREILKNWQV